MPWAALKACWVQLPRQRLSPSRGEKQLPAAITKCIMSACRQHNWTEQQASTHPPGGKPLAAAAAPPPSAIVSERLCGDAHEHCCSQSVAAAGLKGLPSSGLAGTQTQGFAGRPDAAAASL